MIGSQMCFGIRLILASVEVRKAALGSASVSLTVWSSSVSIEVIPSTNGLYIGDSSPIAGASSENTTSSMVTGWPSCHIMPGLILSTIVVGSSHS